MIKVTRARARARRPGRRGLGQLEVGPHRIAERRWLNPIPSEQHRDDLPVIISLFQCADCRVLIAGFQLPRRNNLAACLASA